MFSARHVSGLVRRLPLILLLEPYLHVIGSGRNASLGLYFCPSNVLSEAIIASYGSVMENTLESYTCATMIMTMQDASERFL